MNDHLRPTAPIAPIALLPGDPGRALALAQALLDPPRMSNHHRGLWGYTGVTAAGQELTIQSTGIGGSSAAIVLAELARHGVRRAIRLGTCTALENGPPLGTAIAAWGAVGAEGPSRTLGAQGIVEPNPELHRRLVAAADGEATQALVSSVDLVSSAPGLLEVPSPLEAPSPLGPGDGGGSGAPGHDRAQALDMGTATLFALGARLGVEVASALVVARARPGQAAGSEALDDDALEQASLRLGSVAARALCG